MIGAMTGEDQYRRAGEPYSGKPLNWSEFLWRWAPSDRCWRTLPLPLRTMCAISRHHSGCGKYIWGRPAQLRCDHCTTERDGGTIRCERPVFHLNPLQEAIQHGGDTRFAGLMERLEETIQGLNVPAFVKEVGSGISEKTALKLQSLPVQGIEVAGVGGTSWAKVEAYRTPDQGRPDRTRPGKLGDPTAESVRIVRRVHPDTTLILLEVRGGHDIAKAIALGADLAALARPFLVAAQDGVQSVRNAIAELRRELQIVQFVSGAADVSELRTSAVLRDRRTGERIG